MRATEVEPVSWHHQAIDQLAPGLHAVAWAADGVIEAVEREDHEIFFGVQWHPELSALRDPTQHRLFEVFLRAVRRSMIDR
jgi:putative glutamine amidotransferase